MASSKPFLAAVTAGSLLCLAGAASGQSIDRKLVVSYVEAPVGATAALERSVQAYAAQARANSAAPSVEILHEVGRPNRIAVIERWPGDATAADAGAEAFQRAVDGKIEAPVDRRAFKPLVAPLTPAAKTPFHVLMHVDVVPDGSAFGAKTLQAQREAVLAAPGALGYEVAVQSDRANHFALHETWASRAAYEAYVASPGGRDLRQQLAKYRGAPFDDRFYLSGGTK